MTAYRHIEPGPDAPEGVRLEPLFALFGARVAGWPAGGDISDAADWIGVALAEHGVLSFEAGAFAPETARALVGRLGGGDFGAIAPGADGSVLPFGAAPSIGGGYRADVPPVGALYAVDAVTGGVLFSNAQLAFESLDPLLADYLRTLSVITYADSIGAFHLAHASEAGLAANLAAFPATETAIVARHPLTGKEYLTVSETYTNYVRNVERVFSHNILAILFDAIGAAEASGTIPWEADRLILWDNHFVQHRLFHTATTGTALLGSLHLAQPGSIAHAA